MYGYVRPVKDELKVRELEQYRGVYCGLCHTLKKRYGPLMRFAVNYDMTFLAMLRMGESGCGTCERRCPYHPLRKTACPKEDPAMDTAADETVILAYWKMRDGVRDERFLKALGSRILAGLIRPAYRKAAARRPDFALRTEENLAALAALEEAKTASLDAAADKFALILRSAGEEAQDPDRTRILGELLYSLGRIVYVLDAVDDLAEDEKTGAYNPLRYRFSPSNGRLTKEDEEELRLSLQMSHDRLCSAYALLSGSPCQGILDNIIYYGLPAVTQAVFSGQWKTSRKRKRGRNQL